MGLGFSIFWGASTDSQSPEVVGVSTPNDELWPRSICVDMRRCIVSVVEIGLGGRVDGSLEVTELVG